jgi:hypothetical protein
MKCSDALIFLSRFFKGLDNLKMEFVVLNLRVESKCYTIGALKNGLFNKTNVKIRNPTPYEGNNDHR